MPSFELTTLIERAEHLLWVLARQDVESLSGQRADVLRRLRELELQAIECGITDLYEEVLRGGPETTKIFL